MTDSTSTTVCVALTVTWQEADLPPAEAVMVADPAATAVTVPFATEATAVFEEVQDRVPWALEGWIRAVSVAVSPTFNSRFCGLTVTDSTATGPEGSWGESGVSHPVSSKVNTARMARKTEWKDFMRGVVLKTLQFIEKHEKKQMTGEFPFSKKICSFVS